MTTFLADHESARNAFDEGRLEGFVSLRRKQFAMAEKNPTMAIWLGKQYLGQSDRSSVDMNIKSNVNVLTDDELERIAAGSRDGASSASKGKTLTH